MNPAQVATDGSSAAEGIPWYDRTQRWAQLTLVENDPGRYDPRFWLDYFKRTRSDGTCLSAGGYVAYYPTDIHLHHRSRWMGDTDPFGDLARGSRRQGMAVLARTDPHAVHQAVYDAERGWIAVDQDGNPRRHWAAKDAWITCALGPYNFEFMTEVNKEIISRYDVDGIFSNRWAGTGMCYCDNCTRLFKEFCGSDLPRSVDPSDPARREYLVWHQQRLFELCRLWDSTIREINPEARFVPNSGGGALSELDMSELAGLTDTMFADRQGRAGTMVPWSAGKNAKEYRATMGDKTVGGIFSVGIEGKHRWKDSTQSSAEIEVWVADSIANGMRPWFTKFAGVIYDNRWLAPVERIYRWHDRWSRYLVDQRPLARVAVVYSQQTAKFYGGPEAGERVEAHILGVYQALTEARIPFEMVHDRLLGAEHLARFKTLVLPNIAALSDEQCQQLRDYVADGGSIVATHETSLYDEWGVRRDDLGLGDLFNVRVTGSLETDVKNSYLELAQGAADRNHPLLTGLVDADRIINGVSRLPTEPLEPVADHLLGLVPSYPDLPMEDVFPLTEGPRGDEVYLGEHGRGRVAYFPWDIDRTFWEVLDPDHGRLLENAVRWAMDEDSPVEVTGEGMLDVSCWRQPSSITVHLVNLTNPMTMRGPYRAPVAVGPQQVTLQIPEGSRVRRVRFLSNGRQVAYDDLDGAITVTVPSVLVHEVVAVDLEAE